MSRYVIEGRDTEVQPRQTDFLAHGYSPVEIAEARIDEEHEPNQDWADGWGER